MKKIKIQITLLGFLVAQNAWAVDAPTNFVKNALSFLVDLAPFVAGIGAIAGLFFYMMGSEHGVSWAIKACVAGTAATFVSAIIQLMQRWTLF